jgi:glutathione reductase (NADPH)
MRSTIKLNDSLSQKVLGRTVGEEPEGHRAGSELLVLKLGLMTRQLKSTTAAYPTITSDLGAML